MTSPTPARHRRYRASRRRCSRPVAAAASNAQLDLHAILVERHVAGDPADLGVGLLVAPRHVALVTAGEAPVPGATLERAVGDGVARLEPIHLDVVAGQ